MKNLYFHYFATLFSICFFLNPTFAGTISLDTTFNNTGFRVQNIDPDGSVGNSIAVQTDGKIVLGGWTRDIALYGAFAAIRLNPDGMLDTSFSNDGIVITQYSNFNQVEKLLLQTDGKILLGGTRYFGQNDFAMVRYTTAGALDVTFDGDGGAASPINGISEDFGKDMALQTDGKIVMVGTTAVDQSSPTDIALIRRNPNGSLDTTFSGDGIQIVEFPGIVVSADSVLIQNDGKILVGGRIFTNPINQLLLMRFNTNGSLDTTFGNSGMTWTATTSSTATFRTLAQQSDGKILAGAQSMIARYSPNGFLDSSFGNNGTVNAPHSVAEILVKNDNSFMIAGSLGVQVAVSRYLLNGAIDTNFNNTGTVAANAPNSLCIGKSLALQADGKIVVGGDCESSQKQHFAVFRFAEENNADSPLFDFDGDSKTDISIFRPSLGQWWIRRSSDNIVPAFQFGDSSDKIVPADFTGDGKTDVAFWRPSSGEWFILRSDDLNYYSFPLGASGDIPVPADYDGDGIADAAVFRPSNAVWYILRSSDGQFSINSFGTSGDLPVAADYDGDGKADLAIYRPSSGQWWINRSASGLFVTTFGVSTDKTVPADYTGDGKADIAFWRPETGFWYILRSEDTQFYAFPFGTNGDTPTPGDYDGDGRADPAVFRNSNTTWYLQQSTNGFSAVGFGASGDQPIPNAFVR